MEAQALWPGFTRDKDSGVFKPKTRLCKDHTHESLAHYCHGKNTRMGVTRDSTVLLASAHTLIVDALYFGVAL